MSTEPLTRDGLAKRSGGLWDYVSPSRLNTWLACPLKFKFKYIDGIQSPTSSAAFVGKAVHMGLELFYRHRQLGVTLATQAVLQRMSVHWDKLVFDERMSFATSAVEQTSQKQSLELVNAYLGCLGPNEPRPIGVEVAIEAPLVDPFTGEDFGIPLVGILDLILGETNGPVIADFKTTSRSGEPLEIAHEIQLGCYAFLFRGASSVPETALEIRNLVKTKVPRVLFHRYPARNEQHFGRLFAVIRAYLDDLHSGKFLFRPGLGCGMCDFRRQCSVSH